MYKLSPESMRHVVIVRFSLLLYTSLSDLFCSMKINGALALVTGASQGIGAALAKELASHGAKTILIARNVRLLKAITHEIQQSGGHASYYGVDLSEVDQIIPVLQSIKEEQGVPDIIINNAGIGRFIRIEETTPADAREMIALPYLAAFDVTRFFIGDMLKRNSGHLTFINSPGSVQPWAGAVTYSASRWAMRGLAMALRADLYGSKIRVMHVIAAKTRSNYWENNPGSADNMPGIAKLFGELECSEVATATIRGIRKNRKQVILPFMLKLTNWINQISPWIVEWMVLITGLKRRK
jgi:short-subunit dehydrogenase